MPSLSALCKNTRKRVLINAFTVRALRDAFPPARAAGIMALSATREYYDATEIATRILPALVVLTVDADTDVHTRAVQAAFSFLQSVSDFHAKGTKGNIKPRDREQQHLLHLLLPSHFLPSSHFSLSCPMPLLLASSLQWQLEGLSVGQRAPGAATPTAAAAPAASGSSGGLLGAHVPLPFNLLSSHLVSCSSYLPSLMLAPSSSSPNQLGSSKSLFPSLPSPRLLDFSWAVSSLTSAGPKAGPTAPAAEAAAAVSSGDSTTATSAAAPAAAAGMLRCLS
ncbi:unnamed protein product [Closterium sp. NIES-53]